MTDNEQRYRLVLDVTARELETVARALLAHYREQPIAPRAVKRPEGIAADGHTMFAHTSLVADL